MIKETRNKLYLKVADIESRWQADNSRDKIER